MRVKWIGARGWGEVGGRACAHLVGALVGDAFVGELVGANVWPAFVGLRVVAFVGAFVGAFVTAAVGKVVGALVDDEVGEELPPRPFELHLPLDKNLDVYVFPA